MNVYLQPQGLHSHSMLRTARALECYAPSGVRIVQSQEDADLVILHVIGADAIEKANEVLVSGKRYCAVQYCLETAGYDFVRVSGPQSVQWARFWQNASAVWSYYDLHGLSTSLGFNFYHSPLGIDDAFLPRPYWERFRELLVVTSGYVDGPSAEAVSEVWQAAAIAGIEAIHVGPSQIEGMHTYPAKWNARFDLTDEELAALYGRAAWVSGLRHIEGFEMPGIEGLAMGARPIMFRQPAIEHWYGDFAEYVEDRSGQALVDDLVKVFTGKYRAVGIAEQRDAVKRFDWEPICTGFWQRVIAAMDRCEWPGCDKPALCSSGNYGNKLVCAEHFEITNGVAAVENVA